MTIRAAVVRDSDGLVVNVIVAPDLSFPVEAGHTLREALGAGPGWTWNGTTFDAPPAPTPRDRSGDDLTAEEVAAELVRKGLVDRAEFDAIKTGR